MLFGEVDPFFPAVISARKARRSGSIWKRSFQIDYTSIISPKGLTTQEKTFIIKDKS